MKKINFIIIFSLLISLFIPIKARAVESIDINAKAALLIEADTGQVFYSKNEYDRLYPASTTKIMTALLVIEACQRGDVSYKDMVEASSTFQEGLIWDGSTQNIQPGEIMSLENLLYCVIVASANEACNIVAEYITGGSVADFLVLMNSRAKELGCTNTNFTNTSGIPDENHYTTAYDLYLITREALTHQEFEKICNTSYREIPATNLSDIRLLTTTNNLIIPTKDDYYYQYATGVKTGSTEASGFCLVSSAEKNGIRLISVVMGAKAVQLEDESYEIQSFTESKKLFNWFYNNFSYQDIMTQDELIKEVQVELGEGMDSVIVHPSGSLRLILPNDVTPQDFTRSVTIYSEAENGDPVLAPVDSGQILGEISLSHMGKSYGPYTLIANTDVPLSKIEYMKARIVNTLNLRWVKLLIASILFLIGLYIFFVIRYNIIRNKRRQALKSRRTIQTLPIDKHLK